MSVNKEESFEYDYEKENKRECRLDRQSLDILEEGTFHLLVLNFYGSSTQQLESDLSGVCGFKLLNFSGFFKMCNQYQMKYEENTLNINRMNLNLCKNGQKNRATILCLPMNLKAHR